jgi:flagellin
MGLAIKNNIMASNAARHLGKSFGALASSVERLSSGLRINSAKDDAAGLAVRELMRADIAVLKQGSRNASDGISMLQTMEGATAVMDENLIRMKELAEQAATGSYSTDQRKIMNSEFTEMADEIERIAASTKFNSISMLNDSSGATVAIHVGTTSTIDIAKVDMTKDGLGIGSAIKRTGTLAETIAATDAGAYFTVTDGGAGDGKLTIQLGAETAIDVTLAAGTSTLDETVSLINTRSQAVSGYDAATTTGNATDGFALKVTSESAAAGGAATATFAKGAATGLTIIGSAELVADGAVPAVVAADTTPVNILNEASAIEALTIVGAAIKTKDTARAAFGYKMNRLESTQSVLNIQAENLMTSESRISDVDVATEMATMTRNQVLSQAGVAMLSQANTMPQMALSLLR